MANEKKEKPSETEENLSASEREEVSANARLSAIMVYSVILREGREELERPVASLWWSGIAAGVGISTSVLAEAIIRTNIGADHPYYDLIAAFGYTFGFILVILSRLQLFTENTLTAVLPLLAHKTKHHIGCTLRLWSVVLVTNFVGTLFTAFLLLNAGMSSPEIVEAALEISRHVIELSPAEALFRGIPAGFLIAAIVWMLPSSKGFEVWIIILFTWLIAAGGFTHVIVGSNEIFLMMLNQELSVLDGFLHHLGPTLVGNILGGTGLFAMMAYGQIREEM
ncbi:formate/nitrite transporter family protein [Salinimonas chungwhensis]|uniref:formate/nitrite transporter family protein n=1 Tax=Salinimonas chungwhensis TaxID=265425 RepID=UPI0003795E00|nr:formate/nitrite transporter family protein [Salinimonas chungwhensis]